MQVHLSMVLTRMHFSLSIVLSSLLLSFGSPDAQIKGDSGRVESPFRMKRPWSLLFYLLPFLALFLSASLLDPGIVLVNGFDTEVLLKCTIIAQHKYLLQKLCCKLDFPRVLSLTSLLSCNCAIREAT